MPWAGYHPGGLPAADLIIDLAEHGDAPVDCERCDAASTLFIIDTHGDQRLSATSTPASWFSICTAWAPI